MCSIPIQANKAGQMIRISFALNDTVVKITRAFNARRNTRFLKEACDASNGVTADYLCHLRRVKNWQYSKTNSYRR